MSACSKRTILSALGAACGRPAMKVSAWRARSEAKFEGGRGRQRHHAGGRRWTLKHR
jgi:hypothetical protein